MPYPEDKEKIRAGTAVEFSYVGSFSVRNVHLTVLPFDRNVSFTYPGSDFKALDNVSFKIEAGQLCVRQSSILVTSVPSYLLSR